MSRSKKSWPSLAGLLMALLILSGCAAPEEQRLWLRASGWNRARAVGNTLVGQPAPLALDDAGRIYFLLIDRQADSFYYPRVVALNRQAEVLWERAFAEFELTQPGSPKMFWDGQSLRLFWLSDDRLYHARLDVATQRLEPPLLLSGELEADAYDVVFAPDGSAVVWFAGPRRSPGLYALPSGHLDAEAIPVDPQGVRPDLQLDDAGTLHAVWAHHPPGYGETRLFYAAYPAATFQPHQEQGVARPVLGPTSILHGPWLGLDSSDVYLFWTVEERTGMQAGAVNTSYVHFVHAQPQLVSPPILLRVPSSYDLTYQPYPQGELLAGERVVLDAAGGTAHIRDVTTNPAMASELAIAFNLQMDYLRRKQAGQVSTAFLRAGSAETYQLLSFTAANSTDPFILSDASGYLYLTWLQRGALPGYMVYFTSTAPDIRQSLSQFTPDDIVQLSGETLFGLATGALLLPFVLVWMVVPMVIIGLTARLRGEDEMLTRPGTLVSLGLALAAYWLGKLAVFPGMRDYVPFSAWLLFIPQWMNLPLLWGVPLGLTALALWLAHRFTFGCQRRSLLFFALIYMTIDGILTTAVYGVLFLGGV